MATAPVIDFAAAAVDQLGEIKARIAELKKEEARLAGVIAESGRDAIDGFTFRATVVVTSDRQTLDAKAAEAKLRELGVDGRWFSKNQKTVSGSTSVRVAARKA